MRNAELAVNSWSTLTVHCSTCNYSQASVYPTTEIHTLLIHVVPIRSSVLILSFIYDILIYLENSNSSKFEFPTCTSVPLSTVFFKLDLRKFELFLNYLLKQSTVKVFTPPALQNWWCRVISLKHKRKSVRYDKLMLQT